MDEHILKTKVAGITRGERQDLLARMRPSESIRLSKELSRNGKFEAVAVSVGERQLGWLKKEAAEVLLPHIREGIVFKGWTSSITRAREGHLECEIELIYRGPEITGPGIRTRTKKAKSTAGKKDADRGEPPLRRGGCLATALTFIAPFLCSLLGALVRNRLWP